MPRLPERAQSIVEFALTLPILMLFLLTAIDLGRVYIGYVNMQNMSRIAANFASTNATAWADGNTAILTEYRGQILDDAQNTGCSLPVSAGKTVIPTPTFNPDTKLGSTAKVTLSCNFHLLAPYWQFVGIFPGGNLTVTTASEFPIRTGLADTSAAVGQKPIADFLVYNSSGVEQYTFFTGDTVYFRDGSAYGAANWSWCFDWDTVMNTCAGDTSTLQDPTYVYTSNKTYHVRLVASNLAGTSDPVIKDVQINDPNITPSFTADKTTGTPPTLVTFTDTTVASPAVTTWLWDFGDPASGGANSATTKQPTHTYSNAGVYTVTLTVSNGLKTSTMSKAAYITISSSGGGSPANCTVPNFEGPPAVKRNNALTMWQAAKFTGSLSDAPKAPNGNYNIGYQSIAGNSIVPCTSSIQVSDKAP